jgi:hypothetical protein
MLLMFVAKGTICAEFCWHLHDLATPRV